MTLPTMAEWYDGGLKLARIQAEAAKSDIVASRRMIWFKVVSYLERMAHNAHMGGFGDRSLKCK